jgi:D-lactate dehydrogenase
LGLKAVTGGGQVIRTGCYTTKGVVGYDLTRLLVGSEGTLAVITEATLKLTPLPESVGGVTAHYRSLKSCSEAIVAVMALPQTPSALEFLDSGSLRSSQPFSDIVPADSQAMRRSGRWDRPDVSETCTAILSACQSDGLITGGITENPAAVARSQNLVPAVARCALKINEDIVVCIRITRVLEELSRLSQRSRLRM